MKLITVMLFLIISSSNASTLSWLQSILFDKKIPTYSYELETYGTNGRVYIFLTAFGDLCYYTTTTNEAGLSCRKATEEDIKKFKKLKN